MTIEFLRELILGVAALSILCGGIRLAFKHNLAGGLMLGYGAIPFAVDSACSSSPLQLFSSLGMCLLFCFQSGLRPDYERQRRLCERVRQYIKQRLTKY